MKSKFGISGHTNGAELGVDVGLEAGDSLLDSGNDGFGPLGRGLNLVYGGTWEAEDRSRKAQHSGWEALNETWHRAEDVTDSALNT